MDKKNMVVFMHTDVQNAVLLNTIQSKIHRFQKIYLNTDKMYAVKFIIQVELILHLYII